MIINKIQVMSFFADIVRIQKPKYLPAGVIPLLIIPIDFKLNTLQNYSYSIREQIRSAIANEI